MNSLTVTALSAASARPIIFFELVLDASTERFHTDFGSITWGGNAWLGMGELAVLDEVGETDSIDPEPLRVGLNGATTEIMNLVDSEDVYNREARVYLGALDEQFALVADPTVIWNGFAQNLAYTMGNEEDAVSLTCESESTFFNISSRVSYTDAQLQSEYSGDVFLQYLSQIPDFRTVWRGRSNTRLAPGNPSIGPAIVPGQPFNWPIQY